MLALEHQFARQWARWGAESRVAIACSGGPDSVALLELFCRTLDDHRGLMVVHFHHGLRGDAADQDACFVEDLARDKGLAFRMGRADPQQLAASRGGEGIESIARRARYAFLQQAAEAWGARYLATGHTADDQIETVLHHVIRGTGLIGLSGIPAVRVLSPAVSLVRPLLDARRTDIEDYLRRQQLSWRQDQHNQQFDFLRSRIRVELLPLIERDYCPGVREALLNLSRIAADAQGILQPLAESLLASCCRDEGPDELRLDCRRLSAAPTHLCREMFVLIWRQRSWPLQQIGFAHWQQLAELTATNTLDQTLVLPGRIRVERRGEHLVLRRIGH